MPGKALFELGEEVRRFARDYVPPSPASDLHPVYLGGWPSANFWDGQNGSLAMTSLLYAGQLLAKDPISDWFSLEQYSIPTKMAGRKGFVESETGSLNTSQTRNFLSVVVPALQRLRPLIQAGIIVLVPSKSFIASRLTTIDAVAKNIRVQLGSDVKGFARRFRPLDMPMEDNLRGTLVFAGGDREIQIVQALEHSARYFAAEHALATEHGYVYTAPFEFEACLCEEGIGPSLALVTGEKVIHAILHSRLKLFRGLTPDLVATLQDDTNFGAFRANLFQIYRDIPTRCTQNELDRYISEAEAVMIRPCLREVEREASRGLFSRIGLELKQATVRMSAGVVAGLTLSTGHDHETVLASAGIGAISGFFANLIRKTATGPQVIWRRLYDHGCQVKDEIPSIRPTNITPVSEVAKDYWGIPEIPSKNTIHISSGAIIMDTIESEGATESLSKTTGSPETPYALCPCRSGLKYKFCCKGLERVNFGLLLNSERKLWKVAESTFDSTQREDGE